MPDQLRETLRPMLRPVVRRLRGRRPAPARGPRVAVLTVARDEGDMLHRWVGYYGGQVGVENLIVFDDNSSDGSTDRLPCTVQRIPGFRPGRFEASRIKLVSGVAQGLLQTYDVVVFTDVDEFIIPDPKLHDGLRPYLRARREVPVLAPLALNVVHHPGLEGPLHPSRPILGQRSFAKFAPVMCKPALKRVSSPWAAASHGVMAPYQPDPELFMVHFKFADQDALRRQADRRNAMAMSEGRGKNSSWSETGQDLVDLVAQATAGVRREDVPEFDPTTVDLSTLVIQEGDLYRAPRQGQVRVLKRSPLVRVPERLHGIV
ncbi:glycosyltransferase family 2 protein [Nocardioides sp. KR10-350]|uniref:glycosyltransferase family 2 protein n=1 Tax=Nocardioides cheoyonin TaxID=3156615 RepID=UPI0032B43CCF